MYRDVSDIFNRQIGKIHFTVRFTFEKERYIKLYPPICVRAVRHLTSALYGRKYYKSPRGGGGVLPTEPK